MRYYPRIPPPEHPDPPDIGVRATVRHGFFRHPCTVVQVTGQGKYVKVVLDDRRTFYVFTRTHDGMRYARKNVAAQWLLDLPAPRPCPFADMGDELVHDPVRVPAEDQASAE